MPTRIDPPALPGDMFSFVAMLVGGLDRDTPRRASTVLAHTLRAILRRGWLCLEVQSAPRTVHVREALC